MQCQGVYQRKYSIIHEDRNLGATTAKKVWNKNSDECHIAQCSCCTFYMEWKSKHPAEAKSLQEEADNTLYYQVFPNQEVSVVVNGMVCNMKGTIRACSAAPKGPCTYTASKYERHPYTCEACDALTHGQTSPLNRIINRACTLKYPRSNETRATKPGVKHKFVSAKNLEVALSNQKVQNYICKTKLARTLKMNKRLLSESWHKSPSIRPFAEIFITLMEEGKLSEFDCSFLENWLQKKLKGRYARADEQARKLAILYSNKLGEKMYTTTAPLLGLPKVRQARRIRSKDSSDHYYIPGINDWALQLVASQEHRPLQNGMDGTRVVRIIDLYRDKYLVGKSFPPDVRCFPSPENLDQALNWEQVHQYVLSVRSEKKYASEAYSFNLSDTSGKLPDVMAGSIPESRQGVTGDHILALILEFERRAAMHSLPLIGHCTDSASNALNGLLFLASPSTYTLPGISIKFLGLPRSDYYFFAPFIRSSFPSIAYPCWDHSARTVLRNLMNNRLTLVCGKLDNTAGFQNYEIADIQDLRKLKLLHPSSSSIRFGDITPEIKQNCDATSRVINEKVVHDLKTYLPGSKGTQLYLIAANCTHEPFRNDRFGPPPLVVHSLWKGLIIWRCWRRYIQLTDGLSLRDNFISRTHYITEELLVHAGINHQLALFLCFPDLSIEEYSLREPRARSYTRNV